MKMGFKRVLIVLSIICSFTFTSSSFGQLYSCEKPFVDKILPSWLDEVQICFQDEDKIFSIDQEVPIHMYAETKEYSDWIRIHFFHSSGSGFFEPDGKERLEVIKAREKEQPHIINLQDNERIFGTNLENATNFKITCNDSPCNFPYEQERTFQFSTSGTYYYEITMQTPDGQIYSHFPRIEVFKVLNYDEQLEMDANQILISEQKNTGTSDTESDNNDLTILYIFGALASIFALSLVLFQHFSHYDLKPIFRNIWPTLKTIPSIPFAIYNNTKPVSVKSKKILGKNSEFPALYDIEVRLNKTPDAKWGEFYKKFGTQDISVGKPPLYGNKIVARCSEDLIERNFQWIGNYVKQANKEHSKFGKEQKEKEKIRKEKEKADKEKLKKLKDNFD